MTSSTDRTQHFHTLHQQPPLVLPNAWDVASALIVEAAGARAVATTSAGVAWSLGAPDGDRLDRDLAVGLVARIARAVKVPVTADIEAGFGANADEVRQTLEAVAAAGASGVNIEDGHGGSVREVAEQSERLRAAREGAPEIYLNARIDVYLRGVGDPAGRLDETLKRAEAYLAAGASGIFVPGVTDLATVAELAKNVPAPLNVLAGPGAPTTAELGQAGAARISVGTALASAAYAVVKRAAEEILSAGTYESTKDGLGYGELNELF
ncbi:3-methyl-2-oxobutanoate hydroxymethyltransferase [Lentzea guizhouensis]|uniref:3-methyl-2-oxobutanoate hydroxymethyltransferase n=1 Tax=Lentzea guizhouensis TaxID=1586287 RepID=A0A1B2HKJ9_9PSEU|nr:isocitrate lyase/phosphoenolpyruvate mutase family protein [Lentzea guizhouensis]ANZ38210.1 3-methyl-2-oxobutanoate hydroxymethyltransferase [Lentzea guizhouensis]